MFFNTHTCTPQDEGKLRMNGSYPSGHTTLGWTMALVLAEIRPERQNQLLQRGYEYGQSRVICGAHWQSDVDAGRILGAAVFARLHADERFVAALNEAKKKCIIRLGFCRIRNNFLTGRITSNLLPQALCGRVFPSMNYATPRALAHRARLTMILSDYGRRGRWSCINAQSV